MSLATVARSVTWTEPTLPVHRRHDLKGGNLASQIREQGLLAIEQRARAPDIETVLPGLPVVVELCLRQRELCPLQIILGFEHLAARRSAELVRLTGAIEGAPCCPLIQLRLFVECLELGELALGLQLRALPVQTVALQRCGFLRQARGQRGAVDRRECCSPC